MRIVFSGFVLLAAMSVVFGCGGQAPDETEPPIAPVASEARTIEFTSYLELEELFAELGYTQERWQQGVREVPRLYLTNIPARWRSSTSKTVTVQKKKELFFRLLGPLALRANELVLAERAWIMARQGAAPSARLRDLYVKYRLDGGDIEELLKRVDAVPPSLILAQAAEESGWGTSRFAALGNALFGQWTYGEGIAPLERRAEKGNYSIAAFDSPLDSVSAYLHNINTHPAYVELRELRAAARRRGERASGYELARTLTRYSERGEAYVDSLHTIMRVNSLAPTDEAYLSAEPPVTLKPVDV